MTLSQFNKRFPKPCKHLMHHPDCESCQNDPKQCGKALEVGDTTYFCTRDGGHDGPHRAEVDYE